MLKLNQSRFALLALLPVAGSALAHPGSHADMGNWAVLEHFMSSPLHFGVVAAGAVLLAVGIIWSVRRGR
ncbi:hypothetical protein [Thiothrix nivea]|uniref:Uncharacterized protein n=1 Tax=Thiothrix nivea (strain ATCC 35100 / DSM 5205 / JP2) TaxID=870187 RepID=A0A656H909_THINJ|nr:hypothetical protein [Thiothrix nivea]EIJ32908.1 hypothetical protein Thini_0247 [Thiothrix nivea DSM 5205]